MEFNRSKIAQKLNEKGATKPCHRCGNSAFTILDGFSNITIQKDFSTGLMIGGPTVPIIHIVCNNCGAITPHAFGALESLPKEEGENGK